MYNTGFKRQRMMDHGLSYYGGPSPSYPHMPPPFPAVRLRGLPFDCSEAEIIDFFHGLDVIDVLFVRKSGKFTGEAYCVLANPLQTDFALKRNRQNIGRRYVEVFRSRKDEYYKAIAYEFLNAPGGSSPRCSGGSRAKSSEWDVSDFEGVLRMRGLPFSASKEDIVSFFKDFGVSKDKVHLVCNSEGRPAGEAFVEFAGPEESRDAMSKDRMMLGCRYVELFPAAREDLEEVASRSRLLSKSFDGKDASEPTHVLRMRGLPFSAGRDDISDFFKNFTLPQDSIHIIYNSKGRSKGEAFVEFASEEDAKAALAKDRKIIGSRYTELFPSLAEELNKATSRGR